MKEWTLPTRLNGDVVGKLKLVQSHALTRKHVVVGTFNDRRFALSENERTDTIGVTESDDSISCETLEHNLSKNTRYLTRKHSNTSVSSLASLEDSLLQSSKKIFIIDTELSSLLKSVGEHVEKKLAVRIGVDMAVGIMVEKLTEFASIDDVAVLLSSIGTFGLQY